MYSGEDVEKKSTNFETKAQKKLYWSFRNNLKRSLFRLINWSIVWYGSANKQKQYNAQNFRRTALSNWSTATSSAPSPPSLAVVRLEDGGRCSSEPAVECLLGVLGSVGVGSWMWLGDEVELRPVQGTSSNSSWQRWNAPPCIPREDLGINWYSEREEACVEHRILLEITHWECSKH